MFYVNKISPNVLKRWIAVSVFIFCAMQLNAQTDTTKLKVKSADFSYFRIGVDASKIIASNIVKDYEAVEFLIDANYKNNLVLSSEFGFGNSMVDNEYLSYKSNNLS